ncbi:MAG: M14 family zinc carboxypeptidase, partial [Thermoplasmatota archaeon]
MQKAHLVGFAIGILFVLSAVPSSGIMTSFEKAPQTGAAGPSLVRVDASRMSAPLLNGLEVIGASSTWADLLVPQARLAGVLDNVPGATVVLEDAWAHSRSVAREYHSLEEMEELLQELADNYPDITRLYSIGQSYENR